MGIWLTALAIVSMYAGFGWSKYRRLKAECVEWGHEWERDEIGEYLECTRCGLKAGE